MCPNTYRYYYYSNLPIVFIVTFSVVNFSSGSCFPGYLIVLGLLLRSGIRQQDTSPSHTVVGLRQICICCGNSIAMIKSVTTFHRIFWNAVRLREKWQFLWKVSPCDLVNFPRGEMVWKHFTVRFGSYFNGVKSVAVRSREMWTWKLIQPLISTKFVSVRFDAQISWIKVSKTH